MSKKKKKKNGMTPAQAAAARVEKNYEPTGQTEFGNWWERSTRDEKVNRIGRIVAVIVILFVVFVLPYFILGPIDN